MRTAILIHRERPAGSIQISLPVSTAASPARSCAAASATPPPIPPRSTPCSPAKSPAPRSAPDAANARREADDRAAGVHARNPGAEDFEHRQAHHRPGRPWWGQLSWVASLRVPGRQYRRGQAPEAWKGHGMPLIQLVATGGTIASRSTAAGRQAQATGAELLSRPDNTVSSIARLLGVSRATIYKYVPEVPPGAQPPPCLPDRSSWRATPCSQDSILRLWLPGWSGSQE